MDGGASGVALIVIGGVAFVVGLVLALDVKGLGTAWIKADLRWTWARSDAAKSRRARFRRVYFWFGAVLGALIMLSGIARVA
jgi:hypothetical protein